jgi:hypothetical protein
MYMLVFTSSDVRLVIIIYTINLLQYNSGYFIQGKADEKKQKFFNQCQFSCLQ